MPEDNIDLKKIKEALNSADLEGQLAILEDPKPADIADILDHLSEEKDRLDIINNLDEETLSEVLILVDREIEEGLVRSIPDEKLADIVEEMAPDDAADFLGELDDNDRRDSLLKTIADDDRKEILNLLNFHEESAGGIMTSEFLPFSKYNESGYCSKNDPLH